MKKKYAGFSFTIFAFILTFFINACSNNVHYQEYDIYEVKVKSSLNVRQEPNSKSQIVYKLQNGNKVNVVSTEGDWTKVKIGSQYGYVSTEYLVPYRLLAKGNSVEDSSSDRSGNTVTKNGMVFNIVDLPNVSPDKIFDIAEICHDSLKNVRRKRMEESGSLLYADNGNFTLVYIESQKLLTVDGDGKALSVLRNCMAKDYYQAQKLAMTDKNAGIQLMIDNLVKARDFYNDKSFWQRTQIRISSVFYYLCNNFFVRNILPNDTFFHEVLFSWLFYVPLRIGIFIVDLFGHVVAGFLIIALFYLILSWFAYVNMIKTMTKGSFVTIISSYGLMILKILFILTFISFLIYLIPDYSNAVDLQMHGFPVKDAEILLKQYEHVLPYRGWFLVLMFLVSWLLFCCINGDTLNLIRIPSEGQFEVLKQFPSEHWCVMFRCDEELLSKAVNAPKPFDYLYVKSVVGKIRRTILPVVILVFILDSYSLLYVVIYFGLGFLSGILRYIEQSLMTNSEE